METIVSDNVLMEIIAAQVISKCLEYNETHDNNDTKKNGIVIIAKLIEYYSEQLNETIISDVIDKFVASLDDSDIEVCSTIAKYLGIVMLALEKLT